MKRIFLILAIILSGFTYFYSQTKLPDSKNDIITVPVNYMSKIGSGKLIIDVSRKITEAKDNPNEPMPMVQIAIFVNDKPTLNQINSLNNLGLKCYPQSWTPPVFDHPFGFFLADMPADKLIDILKLDNIKKLRSTEELSEPQNNQSDKILGANDVWQEGWTGSGVKVGILDSGLDTQPTNADLPSNITAVDYSSYPNLDYDVENHVTGHGTHVTGSVLGRGILSINNTGNGGGAYKGVAPEASLVFLKIGNDFDGGGSTNAIINALDAAVNIYHVNLINLSYGYWGTYHDGSSVQDQKIDWCYSQGVPVFLAAGNEGTSGRHYSGTVSGMDSTSFIKILVTNAVANSTYLYFNLVWNDGLNVHKDIKLKYYDSGFNEITNVYQYNQTESSRGTESKYSQTLFKVPAGNNIYYVRVINSSNSSQFFHIYESYNNGRVKFDNPDPDYTICTPATATYGFCVGAFSSRVNWTSVDGLTHSSGEILNNVVSYSSRGPRIDGLQKPDIVAPGSAIISIRDRDVLTVPDQYWVSDSGDVNGDANYYVMEGTSMAAPQCAGAAALYLSRYPGSSPSDVYNALRTYALSDEYTGTTPNNSYGYGKLDIYAAVNKSTPLPVELVSLIAALKNNGINLTWETSTEINNFGFDVERAYEQNDEGLSNHPALNLNWEKIGFVQGHGNSNSPNKYSFLDKNISEGTYYYRLKQIDNDGKSKYSEMVKISKLNEPNGFVLKQNYPNPFNPSTKISFSFSKSMKAFLKVYDVLGNEVATLFDGFAEGNKQYTINFTPDHLASGVYFYKLMSDKYTSVKKMILLR